MSKAQVFFIILTIATLGGCRDDDSGGMQPSDLDTPPNILLIIADDLGKDATNGFTEGSIKPNTPNIDALQNSGLTFSNLWVNPTCSPTRAAIITGKFGYRTGVKGAGDELASSEVSLQKYISEETDNSYTSAIVGKWHLSGSNSTTNPELFGIDYYSGLIRGAVEDYYQWLLTEDGATSQQTGYITEFFTDLAINWVQEQSKPWFLWLAYTAPHTPFHAPPSNMHNQGALPAYADGLDPIPYYMAAIEAMDDQIGRLLENIPTEQRENTVIIFIGDNGTPRQVAQSPYSSSTVKNTLFQGGINTPMFISGYGVTRTGVDDHLINGTDLFATIAEITGSTTTEIHDSKSFKSLLTSSTTFRDFQYSDMNDGTNDLWTISDGAFKLMVNANGNEEMYDLINDPYESNDLLSETLTTQAENAKAALEAELFRIRN
jgi:arylsulfatase A-like enzyme